MLAGWRHEAADGGAAPGKTLPAAAATILVLSCCGGTPLAQGLPHHGSGYQREGDKAARAFPADCSDPEEPCSHAGTGDSPSFNTQQKLCENPVRAEVFLDKGEAHLEQEMKHHL